MNAFDLALSFIVGLAAGAAYFAALWFTVRWLTAGRLALVWLLASAVIRVALLIGVFFWIMDGHLDRLFAALMGFLLVRLAATWPVRMGGRRHAKRQGTVPKPEATDASDA
jgi:F1F0 ATPase subunit 2